MDSVIASYNISNKLKVQGRSPQNIMIEHLTLNKWKDLLALGDD